MSQLLYEEEEIGRVHQNLQGTVEIFMRTCLRRAVRSSSVLLPFMTGRIPHSSLLETLMLTRLRSGFCEFSNRSKQGPSSHPCHQSLGLWAPESRIEASFNNQRDRVVRRV